MIRCRSILSVTLVAGTLVFAGWTANPPLSAAQQADEPIESGVDRLIAASDCASCHAIDRTVVGPSYVDVANRYAGEAGASETIGRSIREGGAGRWGEVAMTSHPDLDDRELEEIVAWILSLNGKVPTAPSGESTVEYTYSLADGESVTLDFQLFVEGEAPKVTNDVFRGYLLYNSYCYRCHGQDATGSQLAPNLRTSLGNGMTFPEYLSMVMVGNDEAGMPSWAGFLTEEEARQTYMYVEGRRLGLVPVGRPPSQYE